MDRMASLSYIFKSEINYLRLNMPNRLLRSFASLLLVGFLPVFAGAETVLKVVQGSHPLDEYAVGALKVAAAQLPEKNFRVEVEHRQIVQARMIEEIKSKKLDVAWLASNEQAENTLLPIRFPLLRGLLGYRICIINPENERKFRSVRNFSDVKGLTFGQGYGWPDVDILRTNDLNVITTSKYENLFYMVEGGRFDGFPRGVLEPWVEIQSHSDLGLTVDPNIVLVYTLPFYLFVDNDNRALAETLHRGLDLALQNGAFDEYFFGHEMIKGSLTKAGLQRRKIFKLDNPTLSSQTPLERKEYWFDVSRLD